jgi:hypothetical protein
MATPGEIAQLADRLGAIANQFCPIVDSALLDRTNNSATFIQYFPY